MEVLLFLWNKTMGSFREPQTDLTKDTSIINYNYTNTILFPNNEEKI